VLEGATILVFADDWGIHPSSAQHLFRRFLTKNRVIWFNTVGLRRPRMNLHDIHKIVRKLRHWMGRTEQLDDLQLRPEIHDIPLAPLFMGRAARKLNAWILRRAIQKHVTADVAQIPRLFIVSTLPLTADLVGSIPDSTFIYYLVDDYASWPGLTNKLVREMDREQARAADRVVAASRALAELHREITNRIDYLPHGVDVDHFVLGRLVREQRKRDDIKPIADAVFFGALDERIDQELFNAVIRAKPDLRFLCLGPRTGSKDRLAPAPNLERRSAVPFDELPKLLGQCEVALLPYVQTELGQRLAPLKALEALAAGLRVVAADIPELRSLSRGAILCRTLPDFISGLDQALTSSMPLPTLEDLAAESWENRAERLSQIMIAKRGHSSFSVDPTFAVSESSPTPRSILPAAKRGHSSFSVDPTFALSESSPRSRPILPKDERPLFPIRILELRTVRGAGGGPEKTILQGAARADSSRFAVTVCYLRDGRDNAFRIDTQAAELNINYQEIHERYSWDPRIWFTLRRLTRQRNFDIIHSHEYKSDLLALLLAKRTGAIPLATIHGWTGSSHREKIYYAFDRRILKWFPRLIAVSDEIRRTLLNVGAKEERIQTVLNGIDPYIFHRDRTKQKVVRDSMGIRDEEKVIGAVGRLETQKRFDILLQAFAQVRSARPQLRLFIVGEGGEQMKLEDMIARLGLKNSCNLLGHRTDIVDLHHAFDLFVQSSDYEGTPNAVLEAMAMETPIVATDVGGTAELIHHGVHGLLTPPGDPGALARAIEQALDEPDATAKRCAAARKRVEGELSFERRMRIVETIYEQLVQEKSARNSRRRITP
jgi:glycosyltransferase involved in cell wall biosynthesis